MARCKQNAPFVMPCLVKLSVVPVVNRGCLNGMGSWMKGKSGRLPTSQQAEAAARTWWVPHVAPSSAGHSFCSSDALFPFCPVSGQKESKKQEKVLLVFSFCQSM